MSAQVLTLPVMYQPQGPMTRRDRLREGLQRLGYWLFARTVYKCPVVMVRRSELERREVNAFHLGRDCERHLSR